MSIDLKTLTLTQREIDLMLDCIGTNIETVKRRHPMTGLTADLIQELGEMDMDIREQAFRDDGWSNTTEWIPSDAEPKEIVETQMFNAGVKAREKVKATAASHAQDRRTFNMKRSRDSRLSETQTHDVWDDSDPKNW
jgi:hypothetical protein